MRFLKNRWATRLAKNPKVRILHNPDPEMSCGIGMFGLKGADPQKLVATLQSKHAIYSVLTRHEEYTGIRITPGVYITLAEVDYFATAVENELKTL